MKKSNNFLKVKSFNGNNNNNTTSTTTYNNNMNNKNINENNYDEEEEEKEKIKVGAGFDTHSFSKGSSRHIPFYACSRDNCISCTFTLIY